MNELLLLGIGIIFIVLIIGVSIFISHLKIKQAKTENEQKIIYLTQQLDDMTEALRQKELNLTQENQKYQALLLNYSQQKVLFEEQKKGLDEKILFLQESEKRLSDQFQKLAQDIFKTKQREINESTQQNLNFVLNPFKEQLGEFKKQIQTHYESESKERHTLKFEIAGLQQMNQNLAQEAINLTNALKGNNKVQGNWGEMILARLLENAGLKEGIQFKTQQSFAVAATQTNQQYKRLQPDVVVYLPHDRQVIIDSKVSLIAYEQYFNAETQEAKNTALSAHLQSIKKHIQDLSGKNYVKIHQLNTLDYVLMFIPIENALQVALNEEPDLIKRAADQNVLLITPTSLMVTLRTVHSLWQQEYKNKNAENIAKEAEGLYDKFLGFVDALHDLGNNLNQAQNHYHTTMTRLTDGNGNLIKRVENLRKLGIKPKKPLNQSKNKEVIEALIEDRFDN